ncbi:hypothetical protein CKJ81_10110 [Corynebacterium hadale]|uniref:DUF3073 domain-containing protein n=2 Tax=Corynebacterium TaxID=1716 RepID=A0A269PBH1_9CORY|nr:MULTISPECIES: DUF3073 domain-containing protein [Corynebacterium]PAJ68773.1 hypothetical protein CIG21_09985 [Corynebacterium hadale]PAT05209.1 hypothetical protein CKJ81_10110 [Corynebacterium hadale]PAT09921.1 hypothetical protein CKJ80_08900 [Corynebacterium hadale]RMD19896.1 DUF3073 domain-containing protein [Corynebacterium gottingense]WJZ13862.1 hypothetical protein CGOTT_09820 [Corynebacterium gottingense]
MGRGRAKAKQTKVARQLKYNTPEMDLDSLQRELAGKAPQRRWDEDDDEVDDQYAEYADWDDDDEDRK